MKVLWFIPIMPKVALDRQSSQTTGTGFWIHYLIDELARRGDIELAVAYRYKGTAEVFEHNGVKYFSIPDRWSRRYIDLCGPISQYMDRQLLKKAAEIVRIFSPDIIHVHGTESIFGLLKVCNLIDVPLVLSMQGLMMPCANFAWGDKTFWDLIPLQGFREAAGGFSLLRMRRSFLARGRRERKILRSMDAVIGRTAWDRSYVWSVAPEAKYFHVDDLMRPEFFESQWELKNCQRYRIYTSGRLTFSKGMHIFLAAMGLLKREYPNLDVSIAGHNAPTCEYRYLLHQISKLGLSEVVHFTGWIPGPQIVKELQRAHVYGNSSFIENGCNALQEAMLMAVPCVAGFVGGMSTTLEHRKTGLMYPRGNAFMLADRIRELFENEELSVSLGQAAQARARVRHNPDRIIRDLMASYQTVAGASNI